MSERAYVTFVMRNDAYVPGALVFAYAIRAQGASADLVCLIGDGVSTHAQETLRVLYDHVLRVEEIYIPHKHRHERQDRPFLFTRFQALRLGADGDLGCAYKDIVVADSDVLPLHRYDDLFDVEAPAGIINERKEHCVEAVNGAYVVPDSVDIDGTWIWHRVYEDIPMGAPIPRAVTDRVKDDPENMGVNAALYRLRPSMALYEAIREDIESAKTQEDIGGYAWPEMQYITAYLSGQWHNLDLRFASFNGYPRIDVLYGIHYAGLKPWRRTHRSIEHFSRYDDYRLWQATFIAMMRRYPALREARSLERLEAWIEERQDRNHAISEHSWPDHVKHLF